MRSALAPARAGRAAHLPRRLRHPVLVPVRLARWKESTIVPTSISDAPEFSGKRLTYLLDEERKEHYIPYVVETSVGCDRALLTCSWTPTTRSSGDEMRVVMRFSPKVAPIKAAILPLVRKDGLPEYAPKISKDLVGRSASLRLHGVGRQALPAAGR